MKEYIKQAMRTCPNPGDPEAMMNHAGFGLCAEIEEVFSAWGDRNHLLRELGDVLWMCAEMAAALRVSLWPEHVDRSIRSLASQIAGILQKKYQGHPVYRSEVQELLCGIVGGIQTIAENVESSLEEIEEINITKLEKRYPTGFSTDLSLSRADDDI